MAVGMSGPARARRARVGLGVATIAVAATVLAGCPASGSPVPSTTTTTRVATTKAPTTTKPTTTTTTTKPTTTTTTTTVKPPAVPVPAGFRLHFNDEFDGTALNATYWRAQHSTWGDGNNELACLTPNNVRVANGMLRITARQERITCPGAPTDDFSSGFVSTLGTGRRMPPYGRFEARVRMPHGQGLWPAFWLMHRDGAEFGEVDVMEYFHTQVPGHAVSTVHWNHRPNLGRKPTWFEAPTATPGWHTFAMDVLPDAGGGVRFDWYIDGVLRHRYVNGDRTPTTRHGTQPVWDVILNMAVGGDWAGHPWDQLGTLRNQTPLRPTQCSIWAHRNNYPNCPTKAPDGTPMRPAAFPAHYDVDYVRVFVPA